MTLYTRRLGERTVVHGLCALALAAASCPTTTAQNPSVHGLWSNRRIQPVACGYALLYRHALYVGDTAQVPLDHGKLSQAAAMVASP